MARRIRSAVGRLVALSALCALAVGCTAGDISEVNTFRLRSEQADVQAAAGLVLDALASELRAEDLLESPYPVIGHVTTTPDPLDPNVEVMHCTEGRSADPPGCGCILLNQGGEFARVKPITWQSAAFYRYRGIRLASLSLRKGRSFQGFRRHRRVLERGFRPGGCWGMLSCRPSQGGTEARRPAVPALMDSRPISERHAGRAQIGVASVSLLRPCIWRLEASAHVGDWRFAGNPDIVTSKSLRSGHVLLSWD